MKMTSLKINDLSPKFLKYAFSNNVYDSTLDNICESIQEALYSDTSPFRKKDFEILESEFCKIAVRKNRNWLNDHADIISLLGDKIYKSFKKDYEIAGEIQ